MLTKIGERHVHRSARSTISQGQQHSNSQRMVRGEDAKLPKKNIAGRLSEQEQACLDKGDSELGAIFNRYKTSVEKAQFVARQSTKEASDYYISNHIAGSTDDGKVLRSTAITHSLFYRHYRNPFSALVAFENTEVEKNE